MGRPKKSEARDTRAAVLEAALEVFSEKGSFGTSLRDIATVVGVRESALYYYFPSKEALLDCLFAGASQADDLPRYLLEAPIGNLAEFLEEVTDQALARYARVRERRLFRLMMSDGIRLTLEGRLGFMTAHRQQAIAHGNVSGLLIKRLVEEGWLRATDLHSLTAAFFGPLLMWRLGDILFQEASPLQDMQAFARNHVRMFLNGSASALRTQPPGLGQGSGDSP